MTINMPKPKLPALKPSPSTGQIIRGLVGGLLAELAASHRVNFKAAWEREKKPTGAGRGGKHYSMGSHYSRF